MSTIGIIGSGNIGATVARLAIDAGHSVILSNSRAPETLWPLAAALGSGATAGTAEQAGEAGDVVVVSVPLGRYRQVPASALVGKVVLDTSNYYPERDGRIAELEDRHSTTSGLMQTHLADAQVVKIMNNIWFRHLGAMGRPPGDPNRTTLPMAGDHPDAKRSVSVLVDQFGYDTYDAGGLAESWRFERDQPAYVTPYGPFDVAGTPTPVKADALAHALTLADRERDWPPAVG